MTDAFVITLVGDSNVGKSTLISTYANQRYQGCHSFSVPPLVDDQVLSTKTGFKIIVRDTVGNDEEGINSLTNRFAYPLTDCFVLCYAINDSNSFNHLYSKWYKIINRYEYLSLIIVGLKSDLDASAKTVSNAEVKLLLPMVKGYAIVTSSSITQSNIDEVFVKAVEACFNRKRNLMNKCYDSKCSSVPTTS